jgi:hypothetical protein
MPLTKRVIYNSSCYVRSDLFEESDSNSILLDTRFSKVLGTLNQLAYISSYALELFDNLVLLTGVL